MNKKFKKNGIIYKKFRLNKSTQKEKVIISKKQIILNILSIFLTLLVFIGTSYSAFVWSDTNNKEHGIVAGNFSLIMDDSSPTLGGIISIPNGYPMSDTDGINVDVNNPYKFKINNSGDIPVNYVIKLENDSTAINGDGCIDNLMPDDSVKLYVTGDKTIEPTVVSDFQDSIIMFGSLNPTTEQTFSLSLWIKSDASNETIGKHFHKKLTIEVFQNNLLSSKSLAKKILGENNANVKEEEPTFSVDSTDSGLFVQQGDIKKSKNGFPTYYYRGEVVNNYVKFLDLMWRVVRINEDSSIKLILNQNETFAITAYDEVLPYNSNYEDSDIKNKLQMWYTSKIGDNLTKPSNVINSIYCNDISNNYTGAHERLESKNPSFACLNDALQLNAKIGLISADELMFSGMLPNTATNNNSYLHKTFSYSTMTPASNSAIYIWDNASSYIKTNEVANQTYALPVVNLNPNILVTSGTGTENDPYIVEG